MMRQLTPVMNRARIVVFRVLTILVILMLLFAVLFIALPGAHAGDVPGGGSPAIAPTPTL